MYRCLAALTLLVVLPSTVHVQAEECKDNELKWYDFGAADLDNPARFAFGSHREYWRAVPHGFLYSERRNESILSFKITYHMATQWVDDETFASHRIFIQCNKNGILPFEFEFESDAGVTQRVTHVACHRGASTMLVPWQGERRHEDEILRIIPLHNGHDIGITQLTVEFNYSSNNNMTTDVATFDFTGALGSSVTSDNPVMPVFGLWHENDGDFLEYRDDHSAMYFVAKIPSWLPSIADLTTVPVAIDIKCSSATRLHEPLFVSTQNMSHGPLPRHRVWCDATWTTMSGTTVLFETGQAGSRFYSPLGIGHGVSRSEDGITHVRFRYDNCLPEECDAEAIVEHAVDDLTIDEEGALDADTTRLALSMSPLVTTDRNRRRSSNRETEAEYVKASEQLRHNRKGKQLLRRLAKVILGSPFAKNHKRPKAPKEKHSAKYWEKRAQDEYGIDNRRRRRGVDSSTSMKGSNSGTSFTPYSYYPVRMRRRSASGQVSDGQQPPLAALTVMHNLSTETESAHHVTMWIQCSRTYTVSNGLPHSFRYVDTGGLERTVVDPPCGPNQSTAVFSDLPLDDQHRSVHILPTTGDSYDSDGISAILFTRHGCNPDTDVNCTEARGTMHLIAMNHTRLDANSTVFFSGDMNMWEITNKSVLRNTLDHTWLSVRVPGIGPYNGSTPYTIELACPDADDEVLQIQPIIGPVGSPVPCNQSKGWATLNSSTITTGENDSDPTTFRLYPTSFSSQAGPPRVRFRSNLNCTVPDNWDTPETYVAYTGPVDASYFYEKDLSGTQEQEEAFFSARSVVETGFNNETTDFIEVDILCSEDDMTLPQDILMTTGRFEERVFHGLACNSHTYTLLPVPLDTQHNQDAALKLTTTDVGANRGISKIRFRRNGARQPDLDAIMMEGRMCLPGSHRVVTFAEANEELSIDLSPGVVYAIPLTVPPGNWTALEVEARVRLVASTDMNSQIIYLQLANSSTGLRFVDSTMKVNVTSSVSLPAHPAVSVLIDVGVSTNDTFEDGAYQVYIDSIELRALDDTGRPCHHAKPCENAEERSFSKHSGWIQASTDLMNSDDMTALHFADVFPSDHGHKQYLWSLGSATSRGNISSDGLLLRYPNATSFSLDLMCNINKNDTTWRVRTVNANSETGFNPNFTFECDQRAVNGWIPIPYPVVVNSQQPHDQPFGYLHNLNPADANQASPRASGVMAMRIRPEHCIATRDHKLHVTKHSIQRIDGLLETASANSATASVMLLAVAVVLNRLT